MKSSIPAENMTTTRRREGDAVESLIVNADSADKGGGEMVDQAMQVAVNEGDRQCTGPGAGGPPPQPARSLRILLAEDNPVNQEVAKGLLKNMGHQVQGVGNGVLAVEALRRDDFDLILMDVQMPEMGGHEATRKIRVLERETGRRTPIIAMTGHALEQDRQDCLAAGMDDYLCKPVSSKELAEVVQRWTGDEALGAQRAAAAASLSENRSIPTRPIDIADLLTRCAGRVTLVKRVLKAFLETTPALMAALEKSLEEDNFSEATRHAHALKGASAHISAIGLRQAMATLEDRCREGDKVSARAAQDEAKLQFSRGMQALPCILQEIELSQLPVCGQKEG